MTYILIWFVWTGNGVTTQKHEFPKHEFCVEAKKQIEAMSGFAVTVKAVCVGKGNF